MRRALLFGLITTLFALLMPVAASQAAPQFGPWLIYNQQTGKCVDIPWFGPGKVDGPVNQYTCDGTANDNQLWDFSSHGWETGGEVVSLWNIKDGLCLDLPYFGSPAPKTKVTQYHCRGAEDNQYFVKVYRPNGGFWLVHQKSRLCLDVHGFGTGGNDAPLTLWHCSDSDDHVWQQRYPWEMP